MILWLASALATPAAPTDLTGTWRMDLHLVHDVKVPVLGRSRSDSFTIQVWTIAEGQMTNTHCSIRAETRMPIGKPTIPEAFVKAIPPKKATIERDGSAFRVDLGVSTIGYTEGALPTSVDDPRLVDHEDDGHPGATITVWAPLFGHVPLYVAQRNHLVLEGTIEDDAVRGQARQTELGQQTLEAGNRLFRKQPSLTPVWDESTFALTRRAKGTTCADLLAEDAETTD